MYSPRSVESSPEYRHRDGERYYAWQRTIGEIGAELDLFKFRDHVVQSDTVVDFGCGSGALLARLPVRHRIGVDVNQVAFADAAARGIEMYASSAHVPGGEADVVISNHALEHTLHPLQELRELHRMLRNEGKLVLWIPLTDWRAEIREFSRDDNHHLYTWTPLLLRNLLLEAGFDVQSCRIVAHAWVPRFHRLRRLPPPLFRALTYATAVVLRRRQIEAVAVKRADAASGLKSLGEVPSTDDTTRSAVGRQDRCS